MGAILRIILIGCIVITPSFDLVKCFTIDKLDVDSVVTVESTTNQNELRYVQDDRTEGASVVTEDELLADAYAELESSSPAYLNSLRDGEVRVEEIEAISTTLRNSNENEQDRLLLQQIREVNDEENELFRERREVNNNDNDNGGRTDTSLLDDDKTTTEILDSGDDFPDFVRPTTPDPDAIYQEDPVDNGIDMEELYHILEKEGVNITGPYVRGRSDCKCGTSARKIVGGVPASIRDYPWTVGLTRGGRPYCGGSLINSHFVVTASHCVDGQSANRISVVIGEEDYASNSDNARPQRVGVSQIIMHERYNNKNIDNDIALLKLAQPVTLGGTVIPVCLPASNANDFTGETATVAGWGATSQGGSTSSQLRKVQVPILSNNECNGPRSRYQGKITQNMLCAGYFQQGGRDSCQGDSGGPLIIENGGRRTLVGIVSWGYGCAQAYAPGVYTRVGRYPDWILSKTRGAQWCQG